MIVFWSAAALLGSSAAALVLAFAARGRNAPPETPEVALYKRQLAEVDDLRVRGLLSEGEYGAARAEAGRRLLAAGGRSEPAAARPARRVLLAVVLITPVLAAALYLAVGSPGRSDQPYAKRLEVWRTLDPARLPPPALAAVAQTFADERPEDPNAWRLLGRARLAAGEAFAAVRALERAAELGGTAEDYAALGEALAAFSGGAVGEDATAAFAEAVKRDPGSVSGRYGLAQAKLAAGDLAGGRAALRALAASLPPGDERRAAVEAEIASLSRPGSALP